MKPVHLQVMGHDLLSVERFRDDTRHMIEFQVENDCSLGKTGQYIRRFLPESGYMLALRLQQLGYIHIYRHNTVIEGHLLPDKPRKKRRG